MHKLLEDTDPSGVSYLLEVSEDDLTIGAMILCDPLRNLVFERIELRGSRRTWLLDHRFWMIQIFAHGRPRNREFLC
ncbi:MAG TPA: hypothetical protein VFV38_32885, partial [Ktedonobacteraceae bacterium]|nr:hypothetical protein [Ktedonobacteraceae bacterium]